LLRFKGLTYGIPLAFNGEISCSTKLGWSEFTYKIVVKMEMFTEFNKTVNALQFSRGMQMCTIKVQE